MINSFALFLLLAFLPNNWQNFIINSLPKEVLLKILSRTILSISVSLEYSPYISSDRHIPPDTDDVVDVVRRVVVVEIDEVKIEVEVEVEVDGGELVVVVEVDREELVVVGVGEPSTSK